MGLPSDKVNTHINIKDVVDGDSSESMSVNAAVLQGCMLTATQFLLHINVMFVLARAMIA